MSDIAAPSTGTAPKSKVLVGGLVLVLAVALFAAAFAYAGGIGIITKLIGGTAVETAQSTTPPTTGGSTGGSTAAPAAGAIPSGVMEDFGKRMYLEQLESAKNIEHLAKGDITSFKVDSIKTETDRTLVNITCFFKDGTKAPGAIALKQDNKQYFVYAIEGLRPSSTGGLAIDTNTSGNPNKNLSLEEQMSRLGVKTFDQPTLATLLSEQKSNQAVVAGIVDGTYTGCTLGAPSTGAGTITIAISLTGKSSAKAQVTIIKKTIDGKERLFVTSFKKL
jgi:hypothetical protein